MLSRVAVTLGVMVAQPVNRLKITECTLEKGEFQWYVNISVKMLLKI